MPDKLPTFLIVGAAKSGTTSLYYYLKEHPEIFMSYPKEPRFFAYADTPSPTNIWDQAITDFEEYKVLFKNAKENQKTGESSVHYLILYEQTIKTLKKILPYWKEVKIVIILRNPVVRAFSNYSMLKLKGAETSSFEEALKKGEKRRREGKGVFFDYVGAGMYYKQVKAYLETFPYVKIYLYEDLIKDPLSMMKDLYTFIGVDNSFVPANLSKKYNPSGIPRSKKIYWLLDSVKNFLVNYNWQKVVKSIARVLIRDKNKRLEVFNKIIEFIENIKSKNLKKETINPETRKYLINVYKEDILKLQDLIKRDLNHWLQ